MSYAVSGFCLPLDKLGMLGSMVLLFTYVFGFFAPRAEKPNTKEDTVPLRRRQHVAETRASASIVSSNSMRAVAFSARICLRQRGTL